MAVSPNLRTNRKFVRLRRLLGNPSDRDLVGSLVMLWAQVFNESPTGDVSTWTDDEIADCAGWEETDVPGTSQGRHGTNGTFRKALETSRFIVAGHLHDWDEWGGYLYKQRQEQADRKRRYREQAETDTKSRGAKVEESVPGTSQDVPGTSQLTNGTERNGTNVRETPIVVSLPSELVLAPAEPERAKPKRKAPETGALAVYLAAWAERYGEEPHPIGGEVVAANKALHPFSPEDRERIIRAYIADEEPWLVEHAHPIGALQRHLDRIRAKLNGKLGSSRRPTPPSVGGNHPTLTAEEQSAVEELRRNFEDERRVRLAGGA